MNPMETPSRRELASYPTYAEAQAAVDRLADARFPVERTAIVAHGLRLVEQVTGRLSWGRVLLGGAVSGALFGAIIGWILGLFAPLGDLLSLVLYAAVIGAVAGLIASGLAYALSGGRRDFSSVSGIQADRYLLLVDEAVVPDAARILGLGGSTGGATSARSDEAAHPGDAVGRPLG